MSKEQAMNIARELTIAVKNMYITEKQAKKYFANIARQYRNRDRMKQLQKTNPMLWMKLCAIRCK